MENEDVRFISSVLNQGAAHCQCAEQGLTLGGERIQRFVGGTENCT